MSKTKRLITALSLAFILMALTSTIAYAFLYSASYVVTNNGTTSYTMLPVSVASRNTWMSTHGFMKATGLDTRVQTVAGLEKPRMVTDNMTYTVIPSPAASQTNLQFTTGSSDSDMSIITGYGGYITTADNAVLEPGTIWKYERSGGLSANSTGNLFSKSGAVTGAYNPTTGNVTVTLTTTGSTANMTPDGVGASNTCVPSPAVANHLNVDDPPNAQDGAATYVYADSGGTGTSGGRDLYNITNTVPSGATINSVTIFFRIEQTRGAGACTAQPELYLGGASTYGSSFNPTGYANLISEALARPGGGAWSWTDLASLQAGITLSSASSSGIGCTQVYVIVDYGPPALTLYNSAPLTNVISAQSDGTNVWLTVGTTSTANVSTASIVNNANSFVWEQGINTYADYIKWSVGGVERIWYQPNAIIVGTVLPNRDSGGSYPGVITWGSNPSGVTVTLGSLVGAATPGGTGSVTTTPRDILPGTVAPPTDLGDGTVQGNALTSPIRPLVTMISNNSNWTEMQVWRIYGFAAWLIVTVWVGMSVKGDSGQKSHQLLTGIISAATVILLVVWDHWVFPYYLVIVAIGLIVAGVIAERSPTI